MIVDCYDLSARAGRGANVTSQGERITCVLTSSKWIKLQSQLHHCVAVGCSNTYSDDVSLYKFQL